MIWFLDSSALVKRYVREASSLWLVNEIVRHQVFISQLTPIEVTAAFRRRFQQGQISEFLFHQARRRFFTHLGQDQYPILEMRQNIVDEALRLLFHHHLRAYDAAQLATALIAINPAERSRLMFITSDAQLEGMARVEGLQTDNPLNH
jgi:predicted nucleic acid-binding protein